MKILFVNSLDQRCGVHQYGKSVCEILKGSRENEYIHASFGDATNLIITRQRERVKAIVVNYHEKLFPWLNEKVIAALGCPVLMIGGHDCSPKFEGIKYILNSDPTSERLGNNFPIPRPVKNFLACPDPKEITIGSCGFSFPSKNFEYVADVVAASYDRATIRLHMPAHPESGVFFNPIVQNVKTRLQALNKPDIRIEVSTDFLSDHELIEFLSENTANVFLYPPFISENRGVSSVIDKALAARKPIAISDSEMYRHINTEDKFLLSKHTLSEIISFGTDHIEPFLEKFSERNLVNAFDEAVRLSLC